MAAAMIAGLALAGCTVGPDWKRPAPEVPPAWRIDTPEAAAIANLRWWQAFGDPVLDQLVEDALRENRDLLQAAARVDQFLGALRTTRSQFYPQIGYGADAGTNRLSENGRPALPPGSDRNYDLYTAALGATWQIDLFGRVRRLAEQAQAQVYASEQGRRGVVLSVVVGVTTAYLALRALDRQLDIARRAAGNYADTQKIFEMRFAGGVVSEVELAQVQSQYQQALAAIPSFERQVAQQENLLSILLGRPPGAIPRGRDIEALAVPAIPAGLPASLLDRRPDILQAEQQLRAANASIGAARALYFPAVSLTGSLGLASTSLDNLVSGSSTTGRIVAGLSGPIFTFGRIAGQAQAAEAARREALAFYESVVLNALRETNDALVGADKRARERDALVNRVEALRRYAKLSNARFDGGVSSYLEVLYAENELFGAELNAVAAQAQRFAELVNVYKALGGGWVDAVDPLGPQRPSGARAPGVGADAPPSRPTAAADGAAAGTAATEDRIAVRREGDTTFVEVTRGTGNGGVAVAIPASGAQSVTFRFRGFAAPPALQARGPRGVLACEAGECRLDGQPVEAAVRVTEGFEVRVPQRLLGAAGDRAEVRWREAVR
jgi:multidrug efflux system outer membrane protein